MGSKAPDEQTVTNKTELPPWVDKAGQDIYKGISGQADKLRGPWMGSLVPGVNNQLKQSWNLMGRSASAGQPALNQAMGATRGELDYDPLSVSAGSFLKGDINAYMNPYLNTVEAGAMDNLERQRQLAVNQTAGQAASAGAFGGSRHAIQEAVTNAETARNAGQLSSQIRAQGFDTASGLMMSDYDRAMQAQLANQSADLQGAGMRLGAANQLAGMADQKQQMLQRGATFLNMAGQQRRDIGAQRLADNQRRYDLKRMAAFEPWNIKMAALQGTPYGGSSSTTGPATTQGASPIMQGLGAAASMASIWSTLAPLMGLSDRTMKEDIEKLGKDPETGLDMYAYRYKGDPKSYPKVVGPMAQDIEKINPDAVKKIGGKRVVKNLGFGGR